MQDVSVEDIYEREKPRKHYVSCFKQNVINLPCNNVPSC